MQINSISYQKPKTKSLDQEITPSPSISFGGALTRLVQKHPMISSDLLQAANRVHKRDNGISGVFPPEFVRSIIEHLGGNSNSQSIKSCVEGIQATLAEASKTVLKNIENDSNNYAFKIIQEIDYSKLIKGKFRKLKSRLKSIFRPFNPANQTRINKKDEILCEKELAAANILEQGFKKYKVISENSTIKVQACGQGMYGMVYRVSFLDEFANNIFKAKAIKYFKDMEIQKQIKINFENTKLDVINAKKQEILALLKKHLNSAIVQNLTAQKIEKRKIIIANKIEADIEARLKTNGLNRETNLSGYIAKASGHDLTKSDLTKFYFTDLNNNYSLFDFSSFENLGPIVSKVDYDSLGIIPRDIVLASKYKNFVENRNVDYGGIEIINKVLAENPVARRIYKKIKHISYKSAAITEQKRIELINELYEQAYKNKLPQRLDVLLGLNEAKKIDTEEKAKAIIELIYNAAIISKNNLINNAEKLDIVEFSR